MTAGTCSARSATSCSPCGRSSSTAATAPPWGHALSEAAGLDLRRTEPPVAEVIDVTTARLGRHKLLFAVQVHETVEPASLGELTARFGWSALKAYDIDEPGHNHGLLLATWGWTP